MRKPLLCSQVVLKKSRMQGSHGYGHALVPLGELQQAASLAVLLGNVWSTRNTRSWSRSRETSCIARQGDAITFRGTVSHGGRTFLHVSSFSGVLRRPFRLFFSLKAELLIVWLVGR